MVKVYQINLHKCKGAQANLINQLGPEVMKDSIFLIQEPHWHKNSPTSLSRSKFQVFNGSGLLYKEWPRAIVIATKDLKISGIESLSSRDMTVVTLNLQGKEVLVCSSYQDITFQDSTYNINNCMEYARKNKKEIIIGTDSNRHSQLWSSKSTNKRGEDFENLIAQYGLTVVNRGNAYTYECPTGKSIIDITLATVQISENIKNWKVKQDDFLSDHKMIFYEILLPSPGAKGLGNRNFKKANWKLFASIMSKKGKTKMPRLWSNETIEDEVNDLTRDITEALDKVCPKRPVKGKPNNSPWWTTELHNMRRNVDHAYKEWKKQHQDPMREKDKWETYKKLRKEYFNSIKRAKISSWNEFCRDTTDIYELNKIIQNKKLNQVSMMETCTSAKESINMLMENHFPGSTDINADLQSACNKADRDMHKHRVAKVGLQAPCSVQESIGDSAINIGELSSIKFINPTEVRRAFNDMKGLNSGGPDELKAIVFQQLPNNIIIKISYIYKACLKLGYTPKKWCIANVIFLAKPSKDRYDTPNSWRPISMFNVLLKGLEKIVKWELERNSLSSNPLHEEQHAFSREKGTDTALIRVVDTIEKGLLTGKLSLGVFIDIKGAFNNLKTNKAIQACRDRNMPPMLISWYESFVEFRIAQVELLGTKVMRKINLGTPQGGVISPLFWNIPFDELLVTLNGIPGISAIGFADDLVLLITGIDESTLSNIMQQAINKAKKWLLKFGLEISPSKSACVMFTNKKKWTKHPIMIDNEEIPFQTEVKYLGLILDSKLLWKKHILNKIGKAKRHLMSFHKAINLKYGPRPALMKLSYTCIVIPALTYGCHVWGDRCKVKSIKLSLEKLNRLACLLMASAAPSTPTKGMEMIFDIMPLNIWIERRASEIMARLNDQLSTTWDGQGRNKRGIIARWKAFSPRISEHICKTDRIPTKLVSERNFKVHPPGKGREEKIEAKEICCYTDGSLLDGRAGCGIHTTYMNRVIYNGNFYLGNNTTVFQAEVTAIEKSASWLSDNNYQLEKITFLTDSQAALNALNNLTKKSRTVDKCINAINKLGKYNKVHIKWVKAHIGIPGNACADYLAKNGSTLGEGHSREMSVPSIKVKRDIEKFYYKRWAQNWHEYQHARQTKIWFQKPDQNKSKTLVGLNRENLSLLIQFLTGHNKLKRHRNIQNNINDPHSCRLCLEEEESSYHVIAECPATQYFRWNIFHTTTVLQKHPVWSVWQILKFLKDSKVGIMLIEE